MTAPGSKPHASTLNWVTSTTAAQWHLIVGTTVGGTPLMPQCGHVLFGRIHRRIGTPPRDHFAAACGTCHHIAAELLTSLSEQPTERFPLLRAALERDATSLPRRECTRPTELRPRRYRSTRIAPSRARPRSCAARPRIRLVA